MEATLEWIENSLVFLWDPCDETAFALDQIYELTHGFNAQHECYRVHEDWRANYPGWTLELRYARVVEQVHQVAEMADDQEQKEWASIVLQKLATNP